MSLTQADANGYFGTYGGAHLPPHLVEPMAEVAAAYEEARQDPEFLAEYERLLRVYVGRPSPLYLAPRFTAALGGAQVYLKREDLNHTGAHKINHTLGEALLAKRMGKKKLIAETGAGQHGVALATAAALMGLECEIHMGAIDVAKQHPNVVRMELLGAKVVAVTEGGASLKEAVDSAFTVYARDFRDTLFTIGSVVGPHPFPSMVRDFQSVVGRVNYVSATDEETIAAFTALSRLEGIIPALESAHALAHAMKLAPTLSSDDIVIVNLSGRGDKDVDYVAELLSK